MAPNVLSDESLALINSIEWLETEVRAACAEAVQMKQYAQRCRRRLVELRGCA